MTNHRVILMLMRENNPENSPRVGLCETCKLVRRIESDRGSIFYMCQRSLTDASFPKYPRLPVLQCRGYESIEKSDPEGPAAQ